MAKSATDVAWHGQGDATGASKPPLASSCPCR